MSDIQITCITKSQSNGGHEHITHVGSPQFQGKWTVGQVIASIDARAHTFFVRDPLTQKRADVGVVRPTGRPPYIRTYADGLPTDNLLSLPNCPY